MTNQLDLFKVFSYNPAITVNQYLWSTLLEINPDLDIDYGNVVPFFPIADYGSGFSWAEQGRPYVLYDRIMRTNYSSFYPIKTDHFLYAVKGQDSDLLAWSMAIQYILDRGDDVAQDINRWNADSSSWLPEFQKDQPDPFYFHSLKVYQTSSDKPRDWSVENTYVSEFVIEACYHQYWSVDDLLAQTPKEEPNPPYWNETTTYNEGDVVQYGSRIFTAKQNNTIGQKPTIAEGISNEFWDVGPEVSYPNEGPLLFPTKDS